MRVLLSVSMLAAVSQAQIASNPPAAEHIVTLSFNSAVLQTAEAQRELGALQAKLAPRQAQLQSLNNEVETLRKQLTEQVTSSVIRKEKHASGLWRQKRRSYSARRKTSGTIHRTSRSKCFRKWRRRFMLFCRRIPSSMDTPQSSNAVPMLRRWSGTLRAIWISPRSSSRPTTRSHLPAR